ncbi:hypothetical protein K488DRAFT_72606 [Vararia minispora EC-137]|uniref:Uncharacterized protein n=1 Tax=Vararia minispora EC-137 TaxID=1314806 RepID=A0ACB8QF62_9AGAM|nr:hypothetical protein K488DRAFT_72606 [Vararia minispora EC-137]
MCIRSLKCDPRKLYKRAAHWKVHEAPCEKLKDVKRGRLHDSEGRLSLLQYRLGRGTDKALKPDAAQGCGATPDRSSSRDQENRVREPRSRSYHAIYDETCVLTFNAFSKEGDGNDVFSMIPLRLRLSASTRWLGGDDNWPASDSARWGRKGQAGGRHDIAYSSAHGVTKRRHVIRNAGRKKNALVFSQSMSCGEGPGTHHSMPNVMEHFIERVVNATARTVG